MKKYIFLLSAVAVLFLTLAACGTGSSASNGQSIAVTNSQNCSPVNNCIITLQYSTGGVGGLAVACNYAQNHVATFGIDFSACNPTVTTPPGGAQLCQVNVSNSQPLGQTGTIVCSLLNGGSTIATTAGVTVSN